MSHRAYYSGHWAGLGLPPGRNRVFVSLAQYLAHGRSSRNVAKLDVAGSGRVNGDRKEKS